MMLLGVKPGMTAIDLLAAGGYVTAVAAGFSATLCRWTDGDRQHFGK